MAASATLRADFRALRKNSRALERQISVEDLARWLTAINRICPDDSKRKKIIDGNNFKL